MIKKPLKFGDILRITFKDPNIQPWYNGFPAIFLYQTHFWMVKLYTHESKIGVQSASPNVFTYIGSDDLLTYINIL